jgi:hypothetical protein
VLHVPSAEAWCVASVRGEYLRPFGWPPTAARLADCQMVQPCDDEHERMTAEAWRVGRGHP